MSVKSLRATVDKLKSYVNLDNQSYCFLVCNNDADLAQMKAEYLSTTDKDVTFVVLKV